MKKFWQTLTNLVRYSTIIVTVNFNPLQWKLLPYAYNGSDDIWESAIWAWRLGWLGISMRIIVDDGSW